MRDWLFRFVKGAFIGSGFILPGVSGGALAAVFGIYERLIGFLAHITRDWRANLRFFLPVGLGGLFGVFTLSFAVSFFLGAYEAQILWFFVGCIIGTIPALWQQAGKEGRSGRHPWITAIAFVLSLGFLLFGEKAFAGGVTPSFTMWVIAGGLIALGIIVPGLSPSNFLVYMGLYKAMADGIKTIDFGVLLPLALGALLCLILLAKLMDWAFARAYADLFHIILGVVFASTVMVIPRDFNYLSLGTLVCVATCLAGIALGHWMSALEQRYGVA
jgi:putative membrane protein